MTQATYDQLYDGIRAATNFDYRDGCHCVIPIVDALKPLKILSTTRSYAKLLQLTVNEVRHLFATTETSLGGVSNLECAFLPTDRAVEDGGKLEALTRLNAVARGYDVQTRPVTLV